MPEVQVALTGASEVPSTASSAAGKGSFWVHPDGTLSGVVETSGMEASAAHLHLGVRGVNGPIVIDLVRTGTDGPIALEHAPISGASWSVPRSVRLGNEEYRAFLAGELYVNVHSAQFPEGEIRGQLLP